MGAVSAVAGQTGRLKVCLKQFRRSLAVPGPRLRSSTSARRHNCTAFIIQYPHLVGGQDVSNCSHGWLCVQGIGQPLCRIGIPPESTQQVLDGLKYVITSPWFWIADGALLVLVTCAFLYVNRPHGWTDTSLVEVRPSTVSGLGLFFLRDLPEGTVLGAYPGRLRSEADYAAKSKRAQGTSMYGFRTLRNTWLDPTDEEGQLSQYPRPGPPWSAIDTSLARVNEPGFMDSLNVKIKREGDEVLFVTRRDVKEGEEAFMDYGRFYDRRGYIWIFPEGGRAPRGVERDCLEGAKEISQDD